ncbi:hypothetical protein VTL71DRAFT_3056 [Oculimacula yallundae]|uniref:Uncharacterized protein n=1 Tax=Oculimacula yallundae TaxID=86028 RepID=A0ABR4C7V8_9HELO
MQSAPSSFCYDLDSHVLRLTVSEEQRRAFMSNPHAYLKFRKVIEIDGNTMHGMFHRGSSGQEQAVHAFRNMMEERLRDRPDIAKALIPSFGVGCRRLTPGPGYLEALTESNVDFVTETIASIRPEGVILEGGRNIDVDVLVCATGFVVSSAPPFTVVGKNGLTLQERWSPSPETYLAVGVDGFPNYFMMGSNNSGVGSGSLTSILEAQGDYLRERVRDFSEYIETYFENTVYMDDCNTWYRATADGKARITALWPGSSLHELEALRSPRWEDYVYESVDQNRLRWFGNGSSVTNTPGLGDPAWYLEPSQISQPLPGKPEDSDEFRGRPFSY